MVSSDNCCEMEQGMRLPGKYFREIIAHAREGSPNETCGLIVGDGQRPIKLYRTTNCDPNPRVRYNVEPLQLLNIHQEIEEKGWKMMAIYHSHPMSEAYPSGTDVSLSYYPDVIYIIVSLAAGSPIVRAFTIVDGQISERGLQIYEESGPLDVAQLDKGLASSMA